MSKTTKLKAYNQHGVFVDFTEATILMDRDLIDEVCKLGLKDVQSFYDEYCKRHKDKHKEEFVLETINF